MPFAPPKKGSLKFYLALWGNLFSDLPYAVARYRSNSLCIKINALVASSDLIVCDFLTPSVSMLDAHKASAVVFQHNVEAMIWKRHATVPQHPLRRAYMRLQWRRMQHYEGEQCRKFRHVVAVSRADEQQIRTDYGASSVSSVLTGVDVEYFSAPLDAVRAAKELVTLSATAIAASTRATSSSMSA